MFQQLPFNADKLPEDIQKSLPKELEAIQLDKFRFALEPELENNKNNADFKLAFSWTLYNLVSTGLHIDDLEEDINKALGFYHEVISGDHEDTTGELYEYGFHLEEMVARVKKFCEL